MSGIPWSDQEKKVLSENYLRSQMNQLMNELPGRSLHSVYGMARVLRLKREVVKTSGEVWTEEEISNLKELYPKIGSDVITYFDNRSKGSLYQKVSEMGIKCEVIRRNTPRVQPILTPSPSLAYIIGVLKGDGYVGEGSINKTGSRSYYVGLGVVHKEFARSFTNSLKNIGLIPSMCIIDPTKYNINSQEYYKVCAVSINFYKWWNNVKDDYEYLNRIISLFKEEFIRGFYESEGSLRTGKNRPKVIIYNTDETLIDFVLNILHTQGFSFRKYGPTYREGRKPLYELLLQKNKEINRFLTQINPCIKGFL